MRAMRCSASSQALCDWRRTSRASNEGEVRPFGRAEAVLFAHASERERRPAQAGAACARAVHSVGAAVGERSQAERRPVQARARTDCVAERSSLRSARASPAPLALPNLGSPAARDNPVSWTRAGCYRDPNIHMASSTTLERIPLGQLFPPHHLLLDKDARAASE